MHLLLDRLKRILNDNNNIERFTVLKKVINCAKKFE
jgi:hypothetical protein